MKCLKGSQLSKSLIHERDIIQNITHEKLDFKNDYHMRVMVSIFAQLTGEKDCPLIGTHWKSIGFQGKHPKTDLRGVGMYGMLQLLAFCEKYSDFAKEILHYSAVKGHEFPMVCLLLNFTFITLEGLNCSNFIRLLNRKKSINNTLNDYYFGMIKYFFEIHKKNNYTIHEVSGLLKEIEKLTKKDPEIIYSKAFT